MTTTMTVSGDAIAVGEDTVTAVNTILDLIDHGPVTIGTGEVTALGGAEGGFANAETDASASGDVIIIRTRGESADGYDISVTKIKVIDIEKIDGHTKIIYNEQDKYEENFTVDIDGNVATASVDGQVIGEDTFLEVDAFALAIEDELSATSLVVTAAVA